VIAGGRVVGAVLYGDTADSFWYLDLIRSGAAIDSVREDLIFGRALAERASGPDRPASARRNSSVEQEMAAGR
jgi:nitrite reductase (NADH) large subunit